MSIILIIPAPVMKNWLGGYFKFIDKWTEKPTIALRKAIISKLSQSIDEQENLPLISVKFTLNSNSSNVYIKGDFNKWKKEPMIKIKNDKWEIEKFLPKGTYRYVFVVDDTELTDPLNHNFDFYENRKVSVIYLK